jgi:hypothetical protein
MNESMPSSVQPLQAAQKPVICALDSGLRLKLPARAAAASAFVEWSLDANSSCVASDVPAGLVERRSTESAL